jgi:hypothetical protein
LSFDGEIFDEEIFDVSLEPEPKRFGYSIPFKLYKRIFATGRISRLENLVLQGQGLLIKLTEQSVHGTGQTNRITQTNININLSRLRRREKCLALGTTAAFSKVVWHTEAKTIKHQRSVWAIQARTLKYQHLTGKTVGKKGFGLILEALGLLELTYSFMYVAVVDDRTCEWCLLFDKQIMSGDDAERKFPYLTKEPGDSIWHPQTHPHCRCLLILLEIGF